MWLFILSVLAVGLVIFFINAYQNKFQSFHGNVFNFVVFSVLLFLVFSVGYLYIRVNPDVTTFKGVVEFGKTYFIWLGNFFSNSKSIVGYAVQQHEWGLNVTSVK